MWHLASRKWPIAIRSFHRCITAAGLVAMAIAGSAPCLADGQPHVKALFPVGIAHDFAHPEKAFEEVKTLILDHYYTDEITREALYWAAIKGMLRHISPPKTPALSAVWTAEMYDKIIDALQGDNVSIGIKSSFNPSEGSLTVTEALPGSPAEGILKPFDRILRIDGRALKGKTLDQINALLSGEDGDEIALTVNRDVEIFDITMVCRKFEQRNLIVTRLTETIAMAEIKRFTADLANDLKAGLTPLAAAGCTGLIIDLRNNPGGVFAEALKTAELFLPKDHILMRSLARDGDLKNYVSANTAPFEFKLALLVNRKSASSSEILAGALQDHQKATLIGTRTYGKGIFERTFTLEDQMRVKFITGAMYTPRGKSWHDKGITPDFLVQQDAKTVEALFKLAPLERVGRDVAVITALKLLKR